MITKFICFMVKNELVNKYLNCESLSNQELDFLENCLTILINEAKLSDALPSIASNSLCDSLGLHHESFEMHCIACILDKIKPIDKGLCREQHIFHVLLQSRFLYL